MNASPCTPDRARGIFDSIESAVLPIDELQTVGAPARADDPGAERLGWSEPPD